MFKIGTALVTGVIAAFLALLSALSAGARFSTTAGRSLLVFLVVADEAKIPTRKEGKAPEAANDTGEAEELPEDETDGEAAEAQAESQGQDAEVEAAGEPAAAVPRGD